MTSTGTWVVWRQQRQLPTEEPPAATPMSPPTRVPLAGFCPTCWAAGRIWVQARNGEGLIPVACRACGGSGSIE